MYQYSLETPQEGFVDITGQVQKAVHDSGINEGTALVFVPHTTAAVTINENADPDVLHDLRLALTELTPKLPYRHGEGNSPAHLKSSLFGCSQLVPIVNGKLALGTWQGIYFCEFDGPRRRNFQVVVQGR
ncbi:MAG: secondary thiamine-phosphate synthase enzyme YjbQ [Anaeromusa sp.]|uniref:secondary thiamine-phosphate synthase enzyme YjbQ n=1 Tax=Anaeromusa sp. TaxID=1872520 RepID=UPI00261C1B20|nr:secondary thiamine-phosphate synthase enzyme YjbQ [Anaeromusa sp.]MDD3158298.1 secondary thiamine-phosphate synthase enzyme YjbQ [Anaeromusa sp.]MEA4834338.1 secondary thiamine-phosphate synthase enzyme YjbQ [Anaeromusa sp.]